MVDSERLAEIFKRLVQIDSISRKEGAIAKVLEEIFRSMGAETVFDGAGLKVESNTGNLIARFQGTKHVPPLLLNAHMDTVKPGEGIKVRFSDGLFTSDGTTVLGGDDKSALAVIIEAIRVLQERKVPFAPLEIVLTICEEIGLLGAKKLDYSLLKARCGYSLDATDTEGIVTRAPAANRFDLTVYGRDAHAGAAPEKGINAIQVASRAISGLSIGRIDEETTGNIGLINGGTATNVVPDKVKVAGEVRSHNLKRLSDETDKIIRAFEHEVSVYRETFPSDDGLPRLESQIYQDFPAMNIPEDHMVVDLAREAASNLGSNMEPKTSGGGSDANIFFEHGIVCGILGTGMQDVHTVRESIRLADMVKSVELLVELIEAYTRRA
ncbi:MAG: peptidase T [Desulfobacterales bacterium S7086C20]|jgi:tripeptide aminopeptidase|nr:MAG: peptidase T [Desulfobacterales bacterium S7086C20]